METHSTLLALAGISVRHLPVHWAGVPRSPVGLDRDGG